MVLRWSHIGFQGLTAIVVTVAIGPCLVSALRQMSLWSAGNRLVPVVAQQREAIAKTTGTASVLRGHRCAPWAPRSPRLTT